MDETTYRSIYKGAQIDAAVGAVLNPDSVPTEGSVKPVASQGVKQALPQTLTAVIATNTTSTSVSMSPAKDLLNTYAVQNGEIVLVDVSSATVNDTVTVTFSVAEAPSSQVTCVAVFKGD